MSGLETAQFALDGKLPNPPIITTLGISLVNVAEGRAAFEGHRPSGNTISLEPYTEMALLPARFSGGLRGPQVLPAAHSFTTLDLHVRFVRAVTGGVFRLRAEAQVTHAGSLTVTAEGRLIGTDGKVYATGTTSCLVLKMEA